MGECVGSVYGVCYLLNIEDWSGRIEGRAVNNKRLYWISKKRVELAIRKQLQKKLYLGYKAEYISILSIRLSSIILCILGIVFLSSCSQYKHIEYPSDFERLCEKNDSYDFIYGTFKVDEKKSIQEDYGDGIIQKRDVYPDLAIVDYLFRLLDLGNNCPQWTDRKDVTKIQICGIEKESIYFIFHTQSGSTIKSKTIYADKDFKCQKGVIKFPEISEHGKAEGGPYWHKRKVQFFVSEKGNLAVLYNAKNFGFSQYTLYLPYSGAGGNWYHLERIE